jgi:hypothetical protein
LEPYENQQVLDRTEVLGKLLKEALASIPEFAEIQIEADFNWRECIDDDSALVPVISIRIKK